MLMTIRCGRYLSGRPSALSRRTTCFALINLDAEKDILDGLHGVRAAGRCRTSILVGLRRYPSYSCCRMVGGLPQRLVLGARVRRALFHFKRLPDVT
jgi:hypothetical protein